MGKIVKKILFVIVLLFFVVNPCFAAQKTKKAFYLIRSTSHFIDLTTYKYDSIKNTFSVDVLFDITAGGDAKPIDSPYDKNYINSVILGTKYYPATGQLKVWYKGFMTLRYVYTKDTYYMDDFRFYYEPYNPKIYNDNNDIYIRTITSLRDKKYSNYYDYKDAVTGELFEDYKKGKLYKKEDEETVSVYYKK